MLYFRSMENQEDIIQKFARNVSALCLEKRISPQELNLSDANKQRLESILNGAHDNVDLIFIKQIAKALGVPAYSLLKLGITRTVSSFYTSVDKKTSDRLCCHLAFVEGALDVFASGLLRP